MKPIKIYITIILLITWVFTVNINAQEKSDWKGHTFQFKAKPLAKGDSLHKFYCMIRKAELLDFRSITVKYNGKSKKYLTKDILNSRSADYTLNRDFVLFNIGEEPLDAPYVTMEGEDAQGKKYNFHQRNTNGVIINPCAEKEKWEKAVARVDSMDYVRKFDNVFIGKDGYPRFNKDGKTYKIERSCTKLEN